MMLGLDRLGIAIIGNHRLSRLFIYERLLHRFGASRYTIQLDFAQIQGILHIGGAEPEMIRA